MQLSIKQKELTQLERRIKLLEVTPTTDKSPIKEVEEEEVCLTVPRSLLASARCSLSCSVCLCAPRRKAYSCQRCDCLLCAGCRSRAELARCPVCRRTPFRPRRNRWAERLAAMVVGEQTRNTS